MIKFKNIICIVICIILCVIPVISLGTMKNNNPLLKELKIENEDVHIDFDYMVTEYVIAVPSTVKELKLKAIPQDEKATVRIKGDLKLKNGANTIEVQVTAEDGVSKQSYFIYATKGNPAEANANLKSLEIENGTLAPKFNSKDIEYVVDYPTELETLVIKAVPEDDNATVQISGNENLLEPIQNITVTVTAEDGLTKKSYKLICRKHGHITENPEGEEPIVQEESEQQASNEIEEIQNLQVKNNLWIIAIISIIVLVIVITIIVIAVKKKK